MSNVSDNFNKAAAFISQLLDILTCSVSELILRKSLKVIDPRCVYNIIVIAAASNPFLYSSYSA